LELELVDAPLMLSRQIESFVRLHSPPPKKQMFRESLCAVKRAKEIIAV